MEKKLLNLFDFQRFAENKKLSNIIDETENRYGSELSDDDLLCVNAAGVIEISNEKKDKD